MTFVRALSSSRALYVSIALVFCAPCVSADAAARGGLTDKAVVVAGRVAVPVPLAMSSQQPPLDGGESIAMTDGVEALVVSVYTRSTRPSAYRAQAAHTQALVKRVGASSTTSIQHRLLGRSQRGQEVRFRHAGAGYTARVVAASSGGVTVVASWSWPDGLGSQLAAVVERTWLQ